MTAILHTSDPRHTPEVAEIKEMLCEAEVMSSTAAGTSTWDFVNTKVSYRRCDQSNPNLIEVEADVTDIWKDDCDKERPEDLKEQIMYSINFDLKPLYTTEELLTMRLK